jgi:hypothetical protein
MESESITHAYGSGAGERDRARRTSTINSLLHRQRALASQDFEAQGA